MKLYCPHCGLPVFFVAFDYGRGDKGETPNCEIHGRVLATKLIDDAAQAQAVAEKFQARIYS